MEKDILTRPFGWCSLQECKKLYDGGLNPNTADMCWGVDFEENHYNNSPYPLPWKDYTCNEVYVPCWSLAALLDLLKKLNTNKFEHKVDYRFNRVSYVAVDDEAIEDVLFYTDGENLVDACVKMLLWHLENGHFQK